MSLSKERIRQIGYDLGTYLAWRSTISNRAFETLEDCDRYAADVGSAVILKGRQVVRHFPGILPSRARLAP